MPACGLEGDRGEEWVSSMLSVGESRGLELTDTESGDTVFEVLEPARRASMQKLEDIVLLLVDI